MSTDNCRHFVFCVLLIYCHYDVIIGSGFVVCIWRLDYLTSFCSVVVFNPNDDAILNTGCCVVVVFNILLKLVIIESILGKYLCEYLV